MGRAIALLVVLVAGCVRPELTLCDELACPVGTVCHPRAGCAAPEQLTACTGSGDGADCAYRGTPGACLDGICEALDCGNLVITPGELCDDGNTTNGDGCSADCRSDETCGNGVTDVAAGELCDDGNRIDADGCSANCLLPRCGDGILDGIEECDPALPLSTTRTCEDFGYYTGALSCNSICRLDPDPGCAGTCGDQVIQSAYEDCDTQPPTESCVDYGYDLGALRCSAVCAADPVRSCERFGWRDLGLSDVFYGRFRGDGDTALIVTMNELKIVDGTTTSILTTAASLVGADVLGGQILYASATSVQLRAAVGAPFVPLPAPTIPAGAAIQDVALADDGTPFALIATASTCEVHAFQAGVWTVQATVSACYTLLAKAPDDFAVATSPTAVEWSFPGGTRSITLPAPLHSLARRANVLEVYDYNGGLFSLNVYPMVGPGPGNQLKMTGNYSRVVRVDDLYYGINGSTFNTMLTRIGYGRTEQILSAPSTSGAPNDLYVARDNQVYAIGNGHLWRLELIARTSRLAPVPADVSINSSLAIAEDGTFIYCGLDLWVSNGAAFQKISPTTGGPCPAVWGTSATNVYVSRVLTGVPAVLNRWNGSTLTLEQYQAAPLAVTKLAGEGATVIALLTSGAIMQKTAGVWTALPAVPATCTAAAIAIKSGAVYASGSCTGPFAVIWKLSGSSWIELHSVPTIPAFRSLLVLATGQIFAANQDADVATGTEGGTWSLQGGGVSELAGTPSGVFGVTIQLLKAWDGARWSPIRTAANLRVGPIAASATDLITLGAPFPTPTPITWYGYLLTPGPN